MDNTTLLPSNEQAVGAPLLSPNDRLGFGGLLATMSSEDPIERGLSKGIVLDTLGMNLNSAE